LPHLSGRGSDGRQAERSAVNDALGGTAAGRLTGALGAGIGAQTQTIGTANLPPYTPAGSVSTSTSITSNLNGANLVTTSGGSNTPNGGPNQAITSFVTGNISAGSLSSFTGSAQGGTSMPLSTIPPSLVTNCLLFAGA
jgi:hypothetical protein